MVVLPIDFAAEWPLIERRFWAGLGGFTATSRCCRRCCPRRGPDLVALAAAAAFTEEVVHGTRDRTGLLIYVSGIENHVSVIADGGIEARVPPGEWASLPWCGAAAEPGPRELDAFLNGLRAIGRSLAVHLPADPDDNPDELPDAPRVRP